MNQSASKETKSFFLNVDVFSALQWRILCHLSIYSKIANSYRYWHEIPETNLYLTNTVPLMWCVSPYMVSLTSMANGLSYTLTRFGRESVDHGFMVRHSSSEVWKGNPARDDDIVHKMRTNRLNICGRKIIYLNTTYNSDSRTNKPRWRTDDSYGNK